MKMTYLVHGVDCDGVGPEAVVDGDERQAGAGEAHRGRKRLGLDVVEGNRGGNWIP